MERRNFPTLPQPLVDGLTLLVLSAAALVLASLDQSTRGPSLTGLVLAHLNLFF